MTIPKNVIAAIASLALLAANLPVAAMPTDAEETLERAERERDLYEDGMDAVDEGQWERALAAFTRVAEMKGSRSDGALYWTAYALRKLGRRAEALRAIETLKKSSPSSRWIGDAGALEMELRQMSGETVAPERMHDEELKIIAINSLMHTDPEKAFPMLEKIVRGAGSLRLKKKALFVLSQSESARAQTLLTNIARGSGNPDLQREAIHYLGVAGGDRNRQLLAEIYAGGSAQVKTEVLDAFMVAGDQAQVHAAASSERNPEVRRSAIRLLGVMGAQRELAAMYEKESSRAVKMEIIRALFVSDDVKRIGELARAEKDPELREEAIRSLGNMGTGTAPLLHEIFAADTNPRIRDAVIDAFFAQGNARALIDLSKKETNRALRREILKKLSDMDEKEAIDFMLQILEQ